MRELAELGELAVERRHRRAAPVRRARSAELLSRLDARARAAKSPKRPSDRCSSGPKATAISTIKRAVARDAAARGRRTVGLTDAADAGSPRRRAPTHAGCAAQRRRTDPPPRRANRRAPPAAAAPRRPAPPAAKAEAVDASDIGDSGSIRVSVEKIDELMNTVGELVITQAMLSQLGTDLEGPTAEKLRAGLAQLERNMRELQESVMRVRMLPISFVFSRFPRMVRDLAQRLGKQIELKLTGEQTELDKTVLEKIGDPLVHLVRNSIDHGIEIAGSARRRGQARRGHRAPRRLPSRRQHRRRSERRRRRPRQRPHPRQGARARPRRPERRADRRADLRADLRAGLLDRREDHRRLRPRRRHGRRAPQHQGARRQDRDAQRARARARASSSPCR